MNMTNEEKNNRGRLLVLSGFSGVGKGTVIRRLMEKYPVYTFSVSATTRAPRPGEQDGREYFFLTHEQFNEKIEKGELLEYATYVSNSYGTPAEYVEKKREQGLNVILDIEQKGAFQIREKCPDALLLYMIPPTAQALKDRIIGRGTENAEQVKNRLTKALEEAPFVGEYDEIVINDDIEATADEIHGLVTGCGEARRDKLQMAAFTAEIAEDLANLLKEL